MAPREGESPAPRNLGGMAEILPLPLLLIAGILMVLVLPSGDAAKYRIGIVALLLLAVLALLWAAVGDRLREQKDPQQKGLNPVIRISLLAAAVILVVLAFRVWSSLTPGNGMPLYPVETGILYFGVVLLAANAVVIGILGWKGTEKPPKEPKPGEPPATWWWTDIRMVNVLGVIIGSILYAGWCLPLVTSVLWCWGIAMILILVLLAAVGCFVSHRFAGVLINEYNCMSLSRFQMVLWMMLILAAIAVVLLARVPAGTGLAPALNMTANCTAAETSGAVNPFCVTIDWRLLALMGISVTSAAGAVLGNTMKTERDPAPAAKLTFAAKIIRRKEKRSFREVYHDLMELSAVDGHFKTLDDVVKVEKVRKAVEPNSQGTKHKNQSPDDARFSDIFHGDEMADFDTLNIAKVQNFFFTMVAAGVYAVLLFIALPGYNAAVFAFPTIPEVLLGIIAISHGGYLGDKFLPHTEQADK